MSNDTQPLTVEPKEEQASDYYQAWKDFLNLNPFVQILKAAKEEETGHVHGPFTFLLNQNHNALRGCTTCGAAWVGSMAGSEENLRWHPVYEVPEED